MDKVFFIGITGGTASGKSTLTDHLAEISPPDSVTIMRLDNYYRHRPELSASERDDVNYDCPKAFDVPLIKHDLETLKAGKSIKRPQYNFATHLREDVRVEVEPTSVVIVEGILVLAIEEIRTLIDFKIFVDTPSDVRLLRRIQRDMIERGRTLKSIEEQYLKTVRPMHDLYVEPSKVYADIIVPEGGYNQVAIDLILARIQQMIKMNQ